MSPKSAWGALLLLDVAERAGFEPAVPEGTPVFETGPFVHSGTSPRPGIGSRIKGVVEYPLDAPPR